MAPVELPEVELMRKRAEQMLRGRTITAFWVKSTERGAEGNTVVDASDAELAKLVGRRIQACVRRAKFIWFELDQPPYPFFTFTLDGDFHFYSTEADRPYSACVEFTIDGVDRFAFGSIRRLCTRIRVGTLEGARLELPPPPADLQYPLPFGCTPPRLTAPSSIPVIPAGARG
eukprot:tig00000093_g3540.t1